MAEVSLLDGLSIPVGLDLEAMDADVVSLQTDFAEQHVGGTGEHSAITCDSITTRDTSARYVLPVSASFEFRKGALLIDQPGNNDHVAGLRPLQWTGRQDNYNPPGIDTALLVEVETDADRSITGIKRTLRQKRLLIFGNRGSYNVTLEHNDSNSEYYNRFGLPGNADIVLGANEYIWLYYDVGSEIWRSVSVL